MMRHKARLSRCGSGQASRRGRSAFQCRTCVTWTAWRNARSRYRKIWTSAHSIWRNGYRNLLKKTPCMQASAPQTRCKSKASYRKESLSTAVLQSIRRAWLPKVARLQKVLSVGWKAWNIARTLRSISPAWRINLTWLTFWRKAQQPAGEDSACLRPGKVPPTWVCGYIFKTTSTNRCSKPSRTQGEKADSHRNRLSQDSTQAHNKTNDKSNQAKWTTTLLATSRTSQINPTTETEETTACCRRCSLRLLATPITSGSDQQMCRT